MPDPKRETISATQTPALLGVSPYLTLWMLKRHFIHGDPINSPEHNRMDWGKRLQPLLLAQAAEDLHLEVRPNDKDVYVRRGLLGCTRDAEIIDPVRGPGSLECKCVFDYGVWMRDWDGGKTVPKHVEVQLQQQMMVGDGSEGLIKSAYTWGVIAVWIGGEMKYYNRDQIPELWKTIDTEVQRFFDDVAGGREGDPFGAPVELPLINRLFAPRKGAVADFTMHPQALELADNVRMMAWHGEQRIGHEKGEKALKTKLRGLIGNAEEARFADGVVVRLKKRERKGYTVQPTSWVELDAYVPEGSVTRDQNKMLTDLAGG